MDRFVIRGGVPLRGSVEVSGSKNAVLALMAAGMLTDEEVTFRNVPRVRDVVTMGKIMEQLGVPADFDGDRLVIGSGEPNSTEAPYDLVRTMRASFMVLGPLLARCGQARVSLPGGCAIGARPVDQHLKGLEALGAKIELSGGYVEARADRLRGGRVVFDMTTVNGTQNVLMAACLATGTTLIENAALEPEVEELIDVLVAMGAQIDGAGTDRLEVQGVDELCGLDHSVSGDRIEAATLIMALAITRGSGVVERIRPKHLTSVIGKLQEAEVDLEVEEGRVRVREGGPLRAIRVKTSPYPGLPHRRAGADDGAPIARRGLESGHRNDFRKSLHARFRVDAHGRRHSRRRSHGRDPGRSRTLGRTRHGHGSARQRVPGVGRPRGARRDSH